MRLFDYLPAEENGLRGSRGQRILVPFGKRNRIGVLVGVKNSTQVPVSRLRRAIRLLDTEPLLDEQLMALLEWASHYYHYPPGEVFAAALPSILRKGGTPTRTEWRWHATRAGKNIDPDKTKRRAPVQVRILTLAANQPAGLTRDELSGVATSWRSTVKTMEAKGWIERRETRVKIELPENFQSDDPPELTDAQTIAVDAINSAEGFSAFLLDGVTGSGKTEVYLRCIEQQLSRSGQSLVLVPEIGLTPQLVERFRRRLNVPIVILHSGLSDSERLHAWCLARDGSASVIIGTRSAIFTPLANPGLLIIDEEHDSSLKQQDGFRYSARDLAVWRARQLKIPIVLGSATPSFESLENANANRYRHLKISQRPGSAKQPEIRLIDLRLQPAKDGLTEPLRRAIQSHLDADGQVLLYLNRRGFAPALMCSSCGHTVECRRCDARMVLHQSRGKLICHHCGSERSVPGKCTECKSELRPVGQGTERLEDALRALYPEHEIVRIDRDTTRRRGEIQRRLDRVRAGQARLMLGTQMLTKGHDFPRVTLVGIIDADQGLFGTDFRSSERLAQSFIQVAGRAGRGERPGEVYIQTLFPDHPLLATLVNKGYKTFADQAMQERRLSGWPPFAFLALLRAESTRREPAFAFLDQARDLADKIADSHVHALGPAPAPMERRSGRYRGQLLIQADSRPAMQRFLKSWRIGLDDLKGARKTRWSLDVDPIELF
jgi:primosomal protein N' (replication factor Y)